ncbi:hypothetical protein BDN71DRAFT_1560814 [Pleurotus eryngii]|uniref:Uncharacterized protein n=1 Tax=Pleurotus eryngii TaxID=5323 RepID=A0A9P5ZGI1_PLEER|nr:hypothetical protein BDN71DRAFT_1560814 [Pleurotus eryngii]
MTTQPFNQYWPGSCPFPVHSNGDHVLDYIIPTASKKVVVCPNETKGQRQANTAKCVQPNTCLDSDSDDIVVVSESHVASASAASLEKNDVSGDKLDELWPDTPNASGVSKSLVLSMLDIEAEEVDEGDDKLDEEEWEEEGEDDGVSAASVAEDSPPMTRTKPSCRKVQVKGKGKAPLEKPAPACQNQQASTLSAFSNSLTNILPPIFAQETGSLADIFGSPVDNPITGDLYIAMTLSLLPLQTIITMPSYSELLPKYTAHNKPEGYMPKLMEVLSRLRNDERFQEERLCLTGWIFDEVFALFSTFVGSVLNQNMVYTYMTEATLQFTSRPAKAEAASAPSTPQKSARHSLTFGRPSPRTSNNQGWQPVLKVAPQFSHLRHPHVKL